MKAQNTMKAFEKAFDILGAGLEKDEETTARAGYPIYKSTAGDGSWVSDLDDRLEVNTANGETVNIWIEDEEAETDEDESERVCQNCGRVIEDGEDEFEYDGEFYCEDCFDELFVTCCECGEVVPRDDCFEYGGRAYCDYCRDDSFTWCDHCEEFEPADNVEEVRVGYRTTEYWCGYCRRNDATCCEDCGEWIADDYMSDGGITSHDGDRVCPQCAESYYYCENCGDYYRYDEYDTDAEMCNDCARENGAGLIRQYHNAPRVEYFGEYKNRGRWRGIGCELEIDREHKNNERETETVQRLEAIAGGRLYYERDGSLNNGFEIITQPHTFAEFMRLPWDDIMNACIENGYTSHDNGRCGLHFHISREAFGATKETQDRAISKLINFFDAFYDEIVKISRRDKSTAERWAGSYNTGTRAECKEFATGKKRDGRYKAVNVSNRATVEVRIMRGTLNVSTFMACAEFCWRVCMNAKKIRWRDIARADKWLDGMSEATIEYIKRRGAFGEVL